MPSHPDRVRANYHKVILVEMIEPQTDSQLIQLRITKADIASQMSKKELKNAIWNKIMKEIDISYRE